MGTGIHVIWDLDGTLLDSYGVMVDSLWQTGREWGAESTREHIFKTVIAGTINSYIQELVDSTDGDRKQITARYSQLHHQRVMEIGLMPHARELLTVLKATGVENYVFTHRGASTGSILENTGITQFFREIITGQEDFPRKPHPGALDYLAAKYAMDRAKAYYVGDRSIDMECANQAGMHSVLYLPENGAGKAVGTEDYVIRDLLELKGILAL